MEGTTMPDGSFKPGVFVFRSLEDCRRIAAYAKGKTSAAVIGGGLLGLEAARGLQNFGLDVAVIHLGGHLMPQQLDANAGAILKTSMERLGVKVLVKKNTTAILGMDRVLGLRFAGVDLIESDEGPMVMEVNSSPGLEGIEKTTGVDVAAAVIEHIEREVTPAAQTSAS